MNPQLSIVTGTRNRPKDFCRLVETIEAYTPPISFEIVVSDASDLPLTLDDEMFSERVRILAERPRLGYSRGYNRAFRATLGEWVIFLNDDCEVLPHYAASAIQFMETHRTIGIGALYYNEPKSPAFHINEWFGFPYANFGIISRALGDAVGWFDEELLMYGADNSLTFRVLLAGKGVAGIPDARVVHHRRQDHERVENYRVIKDAVKQLNDKYTPYALRMKDTFERTRVDVAR